MARTSDAPVVRERVVPRSESIRGWRTYWRRIGALARVRWRPFLVFCAVVLAFNTLRAQSVTSPDDPLWEKLILERFHFEYLAGMAPLIFAALVLSEGLGWHGIRHALATFVALALAIVVWFSIMLWYYGGVLNRPLVEANLIVSDAAFIGRALWLNLAACMLLAAYFAIREREAASARAAQAAQTERAQTERATMAARLKVIQARVEPELLFGVLAEVRRLYEGDVEAADALLDDLIGYLRAALPQMRGEASTLGREASLAAAYLKVIHAGRHNGQLVAETCIASELQDLPFPPMVLLPLVQAAAESSLSRVTITVDGPPQVAPTGVAVEVHPPQRPTGWNDERLAPLRAILTQYFGPEAGLDVAAAIAVARWGAIDARSSRLDVPSVTDHGD